MAAPLTIDDLRAPAGAGDVHAQYALAALLARAGQRAEAYRWLQSAAAGGEPEALYTLATRAMHTRAGAIGVANDLVSAASKGSASAARLVAVLRAIGLGLARDDAAALAAIVDLAKAGAAAAMRELAGCLILQDAEDRDAAALLDAAAAEDPVAAALVLSRAGARRRAGSADGVERAGAALKAVGYPRTEQLSAAASGMSFAELPGSIDWSALSLRLLPRPALALPAPERLCASPDVVLFRSMVAPEICDYVIAHAASRLGPSLVYDPQSARMMRDPFRTSATASLAPVDLDLTLIAVNRLLSRCAQHADEKGEFLSVLRYGPGDQYRPHFDCLPPGPDLHRNGQRVKTALLYLNEDYEGGETAFLGPDIKIKGRRGDVVLFSNVTPNGAADPASRHAGLPVRSGEKWLASKWFRDKNFDF